MIHGKPNKIKVKQRNAKDGKEILIINDGKPILPENRSKIFSRDFTTKESGGLGLTIVQKLFEGHGWKIRLEPVEETIFLIFIPAN